MYRTCPLHDSSPDGFSLYFIARKEEDVKFSIDSPNVRGGVLRGLEHIRATSADNNNKTINTKTVFNLPDPCKPKTGIAFAFATRLASAGSAISWLR